MKEITIEVFEVVISKIGSVMITFTGAHNLSGQVVARMDGADLVVDRDKFAALRFPGLIEREVNALGDAGQIYIRRYFDGGPDEGYLSNVTLVT